MAQVKAFAAVLVRVSTATMKHQDQKESWGRRSFNKPSDYASALLFIIKGSQDRNLIG